MVIVGNPIQTWQTLLIKGEVQALIEYWQAVEKASALGRDYRRAQEAYERQDELRALLSK